MHAATATPRAARRIDDPCEAERAHTQAARLREQAAAARADAAGIVDEARRQLAAAERRAQDLRSTAGLVEQIATEFDARGRCLAQGRAIRLGAQEAEREAAALAGERDALLATAADLEQRLGALRTEREATEVALADAREAGDVQTVASLRAKLTALGEVTADLGDQLAKARGRAYEIGAPDAQRLLAKALEAGRARRAEYAKFADAYGPTAVHEEARKPMSQYLRFPSAAGGEIEATRHGEILAILGEDQWSARTLEAAHDDQGGGISPTAARAS